MLMHSTAPGTPGFLVAVRAGAPQLGDAAFSAKFQLDPETVELAARATWPRVIARRPTRESAEQLAAALVEAGVPAVALDASSAAARRVLPVRRLEPENGRLVLVTRDDARQTLAPEDLASVIDLRLQEGDWDQPPSRALLLIPRPGCGAPVSLSPSSIDVGPQAMEAARAFALQEAANTLRLMEAPVTELRAVALTFGLDETEASPLELALELLACLPPEPAPAVAPRPSPSPPPQRSAGAPVAPPRSASSVTQPAPRRFSLVRAAVGTVHFLFQLACAWMCALAGLVLCLDGLILGGAALIAMLGGPSMDLLWMVALGASAFMVGWRFGSAAAFFQDGIDDEELASRTAGQGPPGGKRPSILTLLKLISVVLLVRWLVPDWLNRFFPNADDTFDSRRPTVTRLGLPLAVMAGLGLVVPRVLTGNAAAGAGWLSLHAVAAACLVPVGLVACWLWAEDR